MDITTVGIDLAKLVFSVCAMDFHGRVLFRKDLKREALKPWLLQLPAGTVVGMEACSSGHYWARFCRDQGLQPRLMSAEYVRAFRKNLAIKNDRSDAEAIATASRQGNMRFVAVKSVEQQTRLSWHRVRDGYKKDRLAIMNRIRGLLAEFGVAINRSAKALESALRHLESYELPGEFERLIRMQQRHWQQIEDQYEQATAHIEARAKRDEACKRLSGMTGVGPMTADAVVSTIHAGDFKNGRNFAAWIGLTPRQSGTGGKVQLGKITARGDRYLRTLLVQGARSTVSKAKRTPTDKQTAEQQWIVGLASRVSYGKLLVAVANKHARQIWSMLYRGEEYDPDAWLKHPMVQRSA